MKTIERWVRADFVAAGFLFLGLIVLYAGFRHTRDWNTASRLLLTYSLVQDGDTEITRFVSRNGRLEAEPLTWDLASPDALRYFCDKAPGQSVLGAVPYWLFLKLGAVCPHPVAEGGPRLRAIDFSLWWGDYLVTLATSGGTAALTASVLFLFLRRLNVAAFPAMATALAYGLSTPALPYATLFYGHTAAGFWLLLSLLLLAAEPRSTLPRICCRFISGFSAGAATATEYTLAVYVLATVVVYSIAWLPQRKNGADGLAFLAGGVLVAIALGWYHWRIGGDPFVPAYRYEVHPQFASVHRLSSGIPLLAPKTAVAAELLGGRSRGLLWYAPTVLGAAPGLVLLFRQGRRRLAGVCLFTFLGLLAVIAGFPNWNGGLATGPRFLVPALPVLFLPTGVWLGSAVRFSSDRFARVLWGFLAVAGAWLMLILTAEGARFPPDVGPFTGMRLLVGGVERERHLGDWLCSLFDDGRSSPRATFAALAACGLVIALLLLRLACRRRNNLHS